MLDLIFSKDIVQLPTLRSMSMSEAEEHPTPRSCRGKMRMSYSAK
jgi:hypothetical protein